MDDKRQSRDAAANKAVGNENPVDGGAAQEAPQNEQPQIPADILQDRPAVPPEKDRHRDHLPLIALTVLIS